ncbi:hypothetical protein, partial [Streptosporangium sp. NPDC048865]|uniref:hypothetical protein n=1 Tax=Streptosporangium sp. NPDC048865 TaxID=3155766 RepID=UPI003437AA71
MPGRSVLEALLTEAFGAPVVLDRVEHLAPWAVLRAYPAGPGNESGTGPGNESGNGPPASVIVKWLRSDPSGLRMDARQVVTERAALRFLSEDLGLGLAPRVLADDMAASLLVLEDLAPRTPLDRTLRREGAAHAAAELAAFARALG